MDKQQRGLLMVEQEESEKKITEIKNKLMGMGQILKELGNAMLSKSENIIFSNAPSGLGDAPIDFMHAPSFNWDKLPKFEQIAKLIQELRNEEKRFLDIKRSLQG